MVPGLVGGGLDEFDEDTPAVGRVREVDERAGGAALGLRVEHAYAGRAKSLRGLFDVVDAEGHLLDARSTCVEELADRRLGVERGEELEVAVADGEHGLSDTLLLVDLLVDHGDAKGMAIELDGRVEIRYGDTDVVDSGDDGAERGLCLVHAFSSLGWFHRRKGAAGPVQEVAMSVIVAGARTPMGRLLGSLKSMSAADLGGVAIAGALERAGVAPDQVDYVIMGQVLQAGTGQMTARQAAVKAGIGMDVPALTINKVCLSGLDAIALADQLIRAGEFDIVVAGGMESMTNAPHLLVGSREGVKYGDWKMIDSMAFDGLTCAFDQCAMGEATEGYNARYGLSREEQDAFSARSHQLAAAAQAAGVFAEEIVPVSIPQRKGDPIVVSEDEGIRADTTVESLGKLRAAFAKEGTITAGNASQISDGAAAVIVMSKAKAEELGLSWLAEIGAHGVVAGPDASLHEQPARAIERACEKQGISPSDLDVIEINEAFAAVGLVSTKQLGLNESVVNVNGGAIALGHPIGMSGARIVLHLAHELRRRGGGVGAAALCGGGGQGDALILSVPTA